MTNQLNINDMKMDRNYSYFCLKNNIVEVLIISKDMNSLNYVNAINDLIKNSKYIIYCLKENGEMIKIGNDEKDLSLDIRIRDDSDYNLKIKDNYFVFSKYFIFFNKINKVNLLKLSDKVNKIKMIAYFN